jgi:hypothetical protein
MKTFLSLCVVVFASLQSIAQSKPIALKFDEFTDEPGKLYLFDDVITFNERVNRLVNRLKRERSKRVYIIHFRARVANYSDASNSRTNAERARWEIVYNTPIKDNVEIIDGGIRELNTLEFWISAKNGLAPTASPTFLNSEAITCPSLYVSPEYPRFKDGEPLIFNAGRYPKSETQVDWTLSAGKILEGQGTDSIRVDPTGAERVTAIASFHGIALPCNNNVMVTARVGMKPYLVNSVSGFNISYLAALLDSFWSILADRPNVSGLIYVYGSRTQQKRSLDRAERIVLNHLAFRRFPSERIRIIRGGYRDFESVDLWLLPPGAKEPGPSPTVDETYVRPIAGRKFGKARK